MLAGDVVATPEGESADAQRGLARRVVPALRRPENWHQLLRFAAVGASGYAVNLAAFSLVVLALGAPPRLGALGAFGVAVTYNFLLNRRWTFAAGPGGVAREARRFFSVSLVGLALNLTLLDALIRGAQLPSLLAQATAVGLVLPVNYLGHRLWTFAAPVRTREKRTPWPGPLPALVGLSAASALALLLLTPDGLVVSSDSAAFFDAADNLAGGDGLVLDGSYTNLEPTLRGRSGFPLVHWAPLYPVILAVGSAITGTTAEAARVLAALLLAGNVAAAGVLTWSLTSSRTATLLGSILVVVSPMGILRHSQALSEPLFLLLLLTGLELLAQYLRRHRTRVLVAACTVLSLALLARYAGVPLLLALFTGLLAFESGPLRRRATRAGAWSVAVATPLLLHLLVNSVRAGTATGRSGADWHPPGAQELASAIGSVVQWFAPQAGPEAVRAVVGAAVVAALIWGTFGLLRASSKSRALTPDQTVRVTLLGTFAVSYVGFLLVSRSLLDAANPLNDRGLAPVYATVLPLAILVVSKALRSGLDRPSHRAVLGLAVAAVTAAYVQQTAAAVPALGRGESAGSNRPEGYLGRDWRNSPTVALVRQTPSDVTLYSNAPDAIFLLTGRRVLTVPVRTDPIAGTPYERYEAGLEAMRRSARAGRALVAWFDGVERGYLPDLEVLRDAVGLRESARVPDGAILEVTPGSR